MSLSAALKAGLGARDTNETSGDSSWDPYPGGDEPSKPTPTLKSSAPSKPSAPARDPIAEPRLSAGLSDALPTPKLSAPPDRKPANANTSSNSARPAGTGGPKSRQMLRHPVTKVGHVNPQQYIRKLDRYHAEQNRLNYAGRGDGRGVPRG